MTGFDVFIALAIALGLAGVVVPLLPGSLLVGGAILVWAAVTDEAGGWVVLTVALALLGTGTLVKYLVPGRKLQRNGVPTLTLVIGGALGIVGFFVVPVIGLPLGFVLGVYLAEWQRTSRQQAWPATVAALKAVGLGILIELVFAVLAALTWAVGVLAV